MDRFIGHRPTDKVRVIVKKFLVKLALISRKLLKCLYRTNVDASTKRSTINTRYVLISIDRMRKHIFYFAFVFIAILFDGVSKRLMFPVKKND